MRYTFPQINREYQRVRGLVVSRQPWLRPVIAALVLVSVATVVIPLLGNHPPPLRVIVLDAAPYWFIMALWIALLLGHVRMMMIGTSVLMVVLVALLAVFSVRQSVPVGVALMNVLPYLLIIPLLAFVPRLWERQYRKNPLLQGDMTVDLTADELRVIRETSTMTHRWDAIVRAAETPEFFLFFVTKASAHYLPKHAVPAADLPELRAFLRAHVPSGLL